MRVEVKSRLDAMARRVADQYRATNKVLDPDLVRDELRKQINYPKDALEFRYTAETAVLLLAHGPESLPRVARF